MTREEQLEKDLDLYLQRAQLVPETIKEAV